MDFLAFAHACGPQVAPTTTLAIVRTESSMNPLVIRDNTAQVTITPRNRVQAERILASQLAINHRLAIGLMQVTTPWATKLHLKPRNLLDACTNIAIGTAILANNYGACEHRGAPRESALACALSLYWSGNGYTGGAYVNRVFKVAGSPFRVRETAGITDGLLGAADASTNAQHHFFYSAAQPSGLKSEAVTFEFPRR